MVAPLNHFMLPRAKSREVNCLTQVPFANKFIEPPSSPIDPEAEDSDDEISRFLCINFGELSHEPLLHRAPPVPVSFTRLRPEVLKHYASDSESDSDSD